MGVDYLAIAKTGTVQKADTVQAAFQAFRLYGVRLLQIDGTFTLGIWSRHLHEPELRTAIDALHPDGVPVIELEDVRVPERYRISSSKSVEVVRGKGSE